MKSLLPVLALSLSLSFLGGCKKPVPPTALPEPVLTPDPAPAPAPAPTPVQQVAQTLARVNFEYDSARLTADAQAALRENAALLQKHTDIRIEIQGHCDERGTTDYNLALGDQRAQAVKRFLTTSGVAAARVVTVSYGEERPLTSGDGEVVWAQNRRAEFRVTGGGDGQVSGTTP